MNMNGIMLQLAFEIAQSMKAPANSMKAFTERTVNRVAKSAALKAIPDRDGDLTKKADEANTKLGDQFHAMFGESVIDTLTQTMFDLLKIISKPGKRGHLVAQLVHSHQQTPRSLTSKQSVLLTVFLITLVPSSMMPSVKFLMHCLGVVTLSSLRMLTTSSVSWVLFPASCSSH